MQHDKTLQTLQRHLIGHGALLIFIGGIIGFGFLFFLLGKIALWPFPGEITYQLPGTSDAWRMAHLEGIINGALLWLMAAILPLIPLTNKGQKRLGYGMIIVGWTIVLASALDPLFANSRGLHFGGPFTNYLAFFLFYIGIVLVMILMAYIAYRSFKPNKD